MKSYKIILLAITLVYISSLISMQQAGRSLLRTAPSVTPALAQPAKRLGSVVQNRAFMSQLPKASSQGQHEEQQSSGKATSSLFDKSVLYGVAGATLGAAYYGQKKEKEISELEKKILQIDQKLPRFRKYKYESDLRNILNKESSPQEISMLYYHKLSMDDFLNIIDFYKTAKNDQLMEFIQKNSLAILDRIFDWFQSNETIKNKAKQWLLKNPDIVIEILQNVDIEGRISTFLDPVFMQIYDILIEDYRFRKSILNFIKKVFSMDKRLIINVELEKYQHILKWLRQDQFENKALLILVKENAKSSHILESFSKESNFISSEHLSRAPQYFVQKIKISESRNQFLNALKQESILLNKGDISFYHGQTMDYALLNDFSNMLFFRLAELDNPRDFMFMRFRPQDFDMNKKIKLNENNEFKNNIFKKEIFQEQEILMQGPEGRDFSRFNTMSVNLFAFGNINHSGEHTFNYVENSWNVRRFNIEMLANNLYLFGVPEEKVARISFKFMGLLKKIKEIYSQGRLVLIAIPKSIIDDAVYTIMFSEGMDRRAPTKIAGKIMHNMSDVINILNDKMEKKEFGELDSFACAIPLTPAIALNPYSGVKYYVYDPEPRSRQEAHDLKKELQALVDETISLLKENGELEKSQKIARNYLHLLHDVHIAEEQRLTGVSLG